MLPFFFLGSFLETVGVERRRDASPGVYGKTPGAAEYVRQPDGREEEDRGRGHGLAAQDEPGQPS